MPIASIAVEKTVIHIQIRMGGPGGIVGDTYQAVHPGESYLGYTFEELKEMGTGSHDLKKRK